MKNTTPLSLAFKISCFISTTFLIAMFIVNYFFTLQIKPQFYLLQSFLVLLITFPLIYIVLQKFIYNKIRLIYKTIHNFKVSKDKFHNKTIINSNILQSVNQEVQEWAEDKKQEIEELRKLESYRREFLGNVSHELKTPIFNIQGYVLTLLDGALDDPNINRKYLMRTEQSIERMIAIIEDLEAISKLESGQLKLNLTKVDILQLVKKVIEYCEINAAKKNIQLYFSTNYEKPIFVYADNDRLHQVFTNLLDNSIKYGSENGKTKISFFDMDENILVEITDNGVGISPENLPRIFERFYREDKSRSREQGGSGLGLAIVKHIIEAHQQTINVRSTKGIGTTFAFTLKKL